MCQFPRLTAWHCARRVSAHFGQLMPPDVLWELHRHGVKCYMLCRLQDAEARGFLGVSVSGVGRAVLASGCTGIGSREFACLQHLACTR